MYLEKAVNEYICYINNDVVVTKDWLKKIVKAAKSDKQIGAVGTMFNAFDDKKYLKAVEKNKSLIDVVAQTISIKNAGKIKRAKTKDNKKNISQGYMNMVEILDEISFLINKQKRINSEGIELAKDWKEIKEENEKYYEKIKDPNVMISVTSLKPYIFEDIFQKKLHGVQGNNI